MASNEAVNHIVDHNHPMVEYPFDPHTHTHTCVTIHDNALSLDAIACTLGGALVPTQCAVCVSPPPRPLRVGYISTQCVIPPPTFVTCWLHIGRALMCRLHPLHVGYAIMCRLHPLHFGYIRYMSVTSVTPWILRHVSATSLVRGVLPPYIRTPYL